MNLPVLALWLRELGKFARRAASCAPAPPSPWLSAAQDWPAFFIKEILPRDMADKASELAALFSAAGGSRESDAISSALKLASGMDAPHDGGAVNSRQRLASIFGKLRLDGRGLGADAVPTAYRLLPLDREKAIFPVARAVDASDYASLWQDFCTALKNLPRDLGGKAWLASLVSIIERYCWCVPSDTSQGADISLFDKAAAAAAICQAILACPQGEEKFLLFGGDLSGIQSFIFGREEEGDKGAVRLLRARSFLLQALTRSIWLCLLDRLGLEHCAKIMDAGGRFILLLPDLPETRARLDKLEQETGRWLLRNFQGGLRMNFAAFALGSADLNRKNFAACFNSFNDLLEQAKLRPFSHAIREGLLPLPPLPSGSFTKGECASCHARPASPDMEDGDCVLCATLKKLGRVLPNAEFIAFSRRVREGRLSFNNLLFDDLALHLYEKVPSAAEAEEALEILSVKGRLLFTLSPVAGHVPEITRGDMENWEDQGLLQRKDGQTFFMGEECRQGNQKNFAMLAQAARIPPREPGQPWRSIAALGICKADVDNLGLIFSMGFGEDFSLSRFAMLARMLNHFFSGWLMRLIQEEYPNLYVVFAGGDDVFVIGPWSETIAFALRMAEEFKNFSGNNPAVSISCGLPVVKAGLPMRGMREEAEGALEQSKKYESEKDGKKYPKNALTLFSQSAHWDEAAELLCTGSRLERLCDDGIISQGFVRRLLGYSRECAAFLKGENLMKNGKYIAKLQKDLAKNALYEAHLYYDLARNWKPMTGGEDKRRAPSARDGDLQKIKELAQNKDLFSKLEMGISWALYRTRTSS